MKGYGTMVYLEGVLVTWEPSINVSAAGAEREDDGLNFHMYMPSDTARALSPGTSFTFTLTRDHELFYRAALTGMDEPSYQELEDEELIREDGHIYPREHGTVFFCEAVSSVTRVERDDYGDAVVKLVRAEIKEKRGEGKSLNREDPLLEAMIHATRLHVADDEQSRKLERRIKGLLEGEEGTVAKKIMDYLEEVT